MERDFELNYRLLQLETLYDLGLALHGVTSEASLIEELLHRAAAVLDASSGIALTWNEREEPVVLATIGAEGTPSQLSAAIAASPIAKRLHEAAPFVASEALPSAGAFRPRQLLATPLASKDELMGFLLLFDKETRDRVVSEGSARFDEADVKFALALSQIGGMALENRRRWERLRGDREKLAEENRVLRDEAFQQVRERGIIGDSPAMQRVLDVARRVAASPVTVLLRGESGTGKELVARLLHDLSPRRDAPFVAINCAAIPETLLEAELFGIERGVATGVEARKGKIEIASGGTLFLDEIGDMPLPLQAKLLRVLQEREVERVGSSRRISVDVRVVAASNRDLAQLVGERVFREDLYYRLRVVEISLPPLRERREDVPKLVRYFAARAARRDGRAEPEFSREAMRLLLHHSYRGNVRELENLVEAALALSQESTIQAEDIPLDAAVEALTPGLGSAAVVDLKELERQYIQRILALTGGNKSRAAKLLGIDRKTLYRKEQELGHN